MLLKRYVRLLRQNPGFTITALAVLAIGIGANTAVFSLVDAVLLRPVPAPEPERIVMFTNTSAEGSNHFASDIKFNLWREQTGVLEEVSGYRNVLFNLTGIGNPQQAAGMAVTSDYFRLFGFRVAHGRAFRPEEERLHAGAVAILSDGFWKRVFGGDPAIPGKSIRLNGTAYEVIGVLAPGAEAVTGDVPDVWVPFPIDPASNLQVHYFFATGRLRAGVTLQKANAQLRVATQEFRRRYPNTISAARGDRFSVEPMREALTGDVRRSLWILLSAVSLVLLIAAANLANLLLIRATGRGHEMAIRAAMGATRGRILREMLAESLGLSIAGGALGLVLGPLAIHTLVALNPGNLPRIGPEGSAVGLDWRVAAFTAGISLATGVIFGAIPALQIWGADLATKVKESSARSTTGFRQNRVGAMLVVGEVSLAVALLAGSGLLIRTFVALREINPGFDSRDVLTMRMMLSGSRYERGAGMAELVRSSLERIRSIPGVVSAAAGWGLPLDSGNSLPFLIVGRPLEGPAHGSGHEWIVSPEYFDALKIPVRRGRAFTDRDRAGAPLVAMINETMARKFWPGYPATADPLQDRIVIAKGISAELEEPPRQVVGIVGDVAENGLTSSPLPAMYIPIAQLSERRAADFGIAWVIRTQGEPHGVQSAVAAVLRESSGGLPVGRVRSMDEILLASAARQDFQMWLMAGFGGIALLLASIGIYGVMAYAMGRRTQEIGIRMALGAEPGDVRRLVISAGMRLAAAGILIGAAGAFGLTRLLSGLLFGVVPRDPAVFGAAIFLLLAAALTASWLPARRATRIDPVEALRQS